MANCPKCKFAYVYFPFYGPPECVNSSCDYFNPKHYLAMKNVIESKPETCKQLSFNYDNDDDDISNWSPYINSVFGPVNWGTGSLSSNQQSVPTYDQAVSASIARSKKP